MFGGGGGGLDPSKMQQMMKQMGIDIEDIDAEEVVIRTAEEELVFTDAEVQRMDAQGQQTYNIVGQPDTRELSGGTGESGGSDDEGDDGLPQEDIEMVSNAAGVSASRAREALEATDGRPADAIDRLR
ncbi:MAG: nascent polypeptide associated complex NAC [halophilic archaeon J07HX64]|jgi:Nascent polypeptide associated complex NAC|nr:MAG: nascent polypeptide associated complex NAC [halophilic archaeon J07HX64]